MNKEITRYELLGLVEDNKAPKKIKYEYSVYELTFERNDYYCKQEMRWFTNEINSLGVLNDKVEILEEDEDIEELKIANDKYPYYDNIEIGDKLNEVIRELNKLRKEINNHDFIRL